MHQGLAEHHCRIAEGIAEVRDHCRRPSPDMKGLSTARLRLSRASAARLRYIVTELIPAARMRADAAALAEIADVQRSSTANRLVSSDHVMTWTSRTIVEDWAGYCAAARGIWAMMEGQMDRERRVFERMPVF